jgi:hypothetical protein
MTCDAINVTVIIAWHYEFCLLGIGTKSYEILTSGISCQSFKNSNTEE